MADDEYGKWKIVRHFKEAGQSHTFIVRTRDGKDGAEFVLKRLKNVKRADRFRQEIEALRGLCHKNILKIVDHDLEGKRPYYVSEFCKGGTLNDWLDRRWRTAIEKLDFFVKIADAINHSHSVSPSVIHRDVKPENIFIRLEPEEPVVGDFGICYIDDGEERRTEIQEALGARCYMAPELEDGFLKDVTPAADVYSLGKLLYWLFARKIFNRERQRYKEWDLATTVQHDFEPRFNPSAEHVARLIDQMVIEKPNERASLSDVILSAKRIAHLIGTGVNPVSSVHLQRCTYCGWGRYVLQVAGGGVQLENLGFPRGPGSPNWRIYVCNECGHVQMFRLDLARNETWWDKQK